MPEDMSARFELAKSIAREGGELALGYFRDRSRIVVDTKLNRQDVVSIADREVETLLRDRIASVFPSDGLIGEEYAEKKGTSGYIWVMDPIDGTSPFVFGIPAWCVSIAVVDDKSKTVIGVVYAPCADEMFAACDGGPASLNGEPLTLARSSLLDGVLGLGANHRVPARSVASFVERLLETGGMFIRNGSGALMLAYVAAGRLAAYYEPHMNAWDCLAGLFLVERAGGWAQDFSGADALRDGGVVLAGAPGTRSELEQLIADAAADGSRA